MTSIVYNSSVTATCGAWNMTIQFTPIEPFDGLVFVGSDNNKYCPAIITGLTNAIPPHGGPNFYYLQFKTNWPF